jgi:hypothetical protein
MNDFQGPRANFISKNERKIFKGLGPISRFEMHLKRPRVARDFSA